MVWRIGIPPDIDGAEFKIQFEDNSERNCTRIKTLSLDQLFFTDCSHALMNTVCPMNKIRAWEQKFPHYK
jgi:hypothetical protein